MNSTGDDIENDLDVEFRQVLYIIRPYINHINSNYHLEKYRIWLERLNNASAAEKYERNQYLIELANQIHDNVLKAPFTCDPPKSLLPRLSYCQRENVEEEEEEAGWPYTTSNDDINTRVSKRSLRSKDGSPPQRRRQAKAKVIARPFQKLGKSSDKSSENSSWCDLSESTTSLKLGGGDTDDEDGKTKLEEDLKDEKTQVVQNSSPLLSAQGTDEELIRNDRKPAQEEIEALKQRMKDLLEVKNALRDTHCLTEDRKKTIESLQNKVKSVEKQNTELLAILEEQSKKFIELEKVKSKELSDFKEKFSILRQKEIEFLQKQHRDEIHEIEKKHSSKISLVQSEIQQKVESVKQQFEEKIKQISDSNLMVLKEKDEKIFRLEQELKSKESIQTSPDQSNEQIFSLKRCISKLDKVLHKNEKDYIRKIEKLKQELEVKDMATQVQLQTQRADLVLRTSASKQDELKNALNNLESKYKIMVQRMHHQASETKKNDEQLIEDLKSLLKKHNVTF